MPPVELEIFMRDLTKAGLASVGKNLDNAEDQARLLINALEQVRAEYERTLQANRQAGKSYKEELANVQALTGQINGLKEGLKKLEAAKKQTNATPMVDTDAVARGTNNLRLQFQQVARELPSLAMGPQMFILAVSNNLPMLADAIANVRKQNELLKASGQKSVPVWKQLGSALISILVAAISLGIVFGRQIGEWISNLGKAKKELSETQRLQEALNTAHRKGGEAAAEETAKLRILYSATRDVNKPMNERLKAVDALQKLYPDYFGKLTDEAILAGNAASAYDELTKAIIRKGQAQAAEDIVSDYSKQNWQLQRGINADTNWTNANREAYEAAKKRDQERRDWLRRHTSDTGSSIVRGMGSLIFGNMSDGKLIEEYERRMANIDKYSKQIAENNRIVEDVVKQIDTSDYAKEFSGSDGTSGGNSRQDYASKLSEARLRAQQTTERLRIQIMQEGMEKRRALARQEYEEAIADINKQEQDTLATMEAARKQGDIIPDSQYEQVRQNADRQRILQHQVLNQKLTDVDREYQERSIEAQIEYNKQYGTYAEKRAAIIAEGLRKAAKAETNGDRDLIMRQTEDALKELDFAHFKDSINFADVFGQLDTQTTDALTILRDKLKEYINNAANELGPEDLKELQDAFKELDLKIAERDPFGELRGGMDEYRTAQGGVERAQAELNAVMQGGEVITGLYMDENGRLCRSLLTLEQAEDNLNSAQQKRQQTLEKLTRSANSIGAQGMQVVNAGRDIVEMLGNFGVEVPEAVTSTLDGLGQVMSGLESIDLTKPFSMITGSVSILAGIGNTIAGLFGGGRDFSEYEELKSRYEALSDIWDTLISKKQEYIDIDYGVEAQKAADEARQLVEVSIQRQRQLAEALGRSGSGWFSRSEGYKIRTGMGEEGWKRLSDLVGQDVGSIYDVINLDPSVIGKVLQDEQFVSVLTDVNSEFITYIENIEKYGEQLEEIARQEQEAITGIGFDAFKDGYIDMLADLDSTNEDFAKNFEGYLQNAILRSLIANKYAADIKALYDDWTEMGADGLNKEEVEALRQQQQALTDRLLAEREQLKDLFGWTSDEVATGSGQSPQSGALTTMSQDSISAFEGIGRSVQTHVISLDETVKQLKESRQADSEALSQIAENTSHLLPIREILEKMDRDGIKVQ